MSLTTAGLKATRATEKERVLEVEECGRWGGRVSAHAVSPLSRKRTEATSYQQYMEHEILPMNYTMIALCTHRGWLQEPPSALLSWALSSLFLALPLQESPPPVLLHRELLLRCRSCSEYRLCEEENDRICFNRWVTSQPVQNAKLEFIT